MRTCRLVIKGELSSLALEAVGVVVAAEYVGGTTVLIVTVPDQAGVHGLVAHLDDLGLTMLELNQLDENPDSPR